MTKSSPRRGPTDGRDDVPDITTYPNAIRYLLRRTDIERTRAARLGNQTFKLDRTRKLLDALERPQDGFRSIHIAGTVGKGSTVAMLDSILRECGYAVGTYTSPHLVDIRERITINGRMIGKSEFMRLIQIVSKAAESLDFEPTFFEMMTAIAFVEFADQAVDLAVVETGLGGRLDCTNVLTPDVTGITLIDYDHMHILGNTLGDIAREKAGIFKRGVPAFSVEQRPKVASVLREEAEKIGAPLKIVNKDIEFSARFGSSAERGPESQVCLFTPTSRFEHVPVPLPGEHQALNCGLVLAIVDQLRSTWCNLPEMDVHNGLAATTLSGRLELVCDQPRIVVDGAHNTAALAALMRSIGAHVPYDSMVVIFGCCEDKDIPAMLDTVARGGDKVIFTRARGTPRAADPEELQRRYTEQTGKMSQFAPNLKDALDLAARAVGREDLICITGSFYLVGEAKKHLAELERKAALAR